MIMSDQRRTPDRAMIDCDTAMRLLWDCLDGKLGPVDDAAVREHVDMCRHCHPHAAFGEIVLGAVAQQRAPIPDVSSLRVRVLDALRAEGFAADWETP